MPVRITHAKALVMWTYHADLLARQVPRYTSYPTAVEFNDSVGMQAMDSALARIAADTPLSLYAHIPYCKEICYYCGCNTAAANKRQRLQSYLTALETEIGLIGQKLGRRGKVRHIAFGGGSPNAITPLDFVRLFDRILTIMPVADPMISVELDPRILTEDWASTLGYCGVTRASLGVQSFSPAIQKAIGRVQPFGMVEASVTKLRRHGIDAINFDLVYGLPGQTLGDLEETLELTLRLNPSRVALFGYAHLPHVIPRQRQIDGDTLPDAATRFEMAAVGYQMMIDAGYMPIGFDHFARGDDPLATAARAGTVHRNFQGFTEDDNPVLIGMGASAISCFPHTIIQNEKNMGRYGMMMSRPRLAAVKGVMRTEEDQLRGQIIEKFLCNGTTGPVPGALLGQARREASPYVERGIARWNGDALELCADGLPYARVVASIFDQYRKQAGASFSNAI